MTDIYRQRFDTLLWVKKSPNAHEKMLFLRAQKYIAWLSWIPGIEMVAVCNSLSMYATHLDSDIDLFIVTEDRMIWFVRFVVTVTLFLRWVWRHGDDIAGNFCLSFFVTDNAWKLSQIAHDDDIYLREWMYHLKPILAHDGVYERFLEANRWVEMDNFQNKKNLQYLITEKPKKHNKWLSSFFYLLNQCIRYVLLPKTQRAYTKLWSPKWVIISDTMLKFHDKDRRSEINTAILKKNFDK